MRHSLRRLSLGVSLVAACLMLVVVMMWEEGLPRGGPFPTGQADSMAAQARSNVQNPSSMRDRPAANASSPALAPTDVLSGEVRTPEELRAVVRYCRAADSSDATRLQDAALESEDPLVVGNAIRALGRLGLARGDTRIPDLLDDPRPRVRQEAVIAMGRSGDPAVVEDLAPLIKSEDSTLRTLALQALGRLGGLRAQALVKEILADSASTTSDRAFARAALSSSGSPLVSSNGTIPLKRTLDQGTGNDE